MSKRIPAIGAMALGLALAFPAVAQTPATKPMVKDMAAEVKAVKVTAVVQAIDVKNRIVTLTGPEGNTFSVYVDERVKNLPQVKAGDSVVIEYIQAVAVDFQKGDGIRMATMVDDSARAKAGQKPGAAAMRKITTVSNIWAVNQAKGTVLVRGPFGHFTEITLKDPSLLTGVKVGDQMKVTYTDAVAIAVTPAPK
jgi:hypothetical protein